MVRLQSQDFTQQYGLTAKRILPDPRFYEFVHTDSILLSMAIMLGVRNQLELFRRPMEGQDLMLVVNLERYLVNSINRALDDPVRGISDQLLVLVALYAAYEIKHGDAQRYRVHMDGLVRMISLRGGLAVIGRFDPYIVRFLNWVDVNSSKIAGSEGYLQYMSNNLGIGRPQANTRVFRARSEMDPERITDEGV